MPVRVLVVDDDPDVLDAVHTGLSEEGFIVSTAGGSTMALQLFAAQRPTIVVLDVEMEARDSGHRLCRAITSESDIPVIFLTSRDTDIDTVVGLELGADDYVAKPFSSRVLAARIRSVLRRHGREGELPTGASASRVWEIGDFVIDETRLLMQTAAGEVSLSRTEFLILRALAKDVGRVLSRNDIISEVYGAGEQSTSPRTVDSHVRRLRAKMNEIGTDPIQTVRGVGYKLRS